MGTGVERTVFTTDEQERHSNREFLSSGGHIWCFFEDGALDDSGELTRPKELAINKIGHAQHDLDPVFEAFSYTDELAGVAADIGLADALALQSMYIFKQPGIGGEVACHQDSTFLYTDPLSVTGVLVRPSRTPPSRTAASGRHPAGTPLRSANSSSGCGDDSDGTVFEQLDTTPLPTPPDDLVPLEVPAGTLVVLDGRLPRTGAT